MDIASNLPFVLRINNNACEQFAATEEEIYADEFPTIKIVENEEVTILFNSSDSTARLYLDALDIFLDYSSHLLEFLYLGH